MTIPQTAMLTTGRTVSVHGDTLLAQASVIKIPVLWRVMEAVDAGELDLNASYTLRPEEAVGGSGGLQTQLKEGAVTLTLTELLRKMIEDSDNTATNKVIALAGMERVNESMEKLGLRQTKLQRIMMDTAASRAGRENLSTANEMARLLQRVWQAERGGVAAGRRMVEWMKLVRGETAPRCRAARRRQDGSTDRRAKRSRHRLSRQASLRAGCAGKGFFIGIRVSLARWRNWYMAISSNSRKRPLRQPGLGAVVPARNCCYLKDPGRQTNTDAENSDGTLARRLKAWWRPSHHAKPDPPRDALFIFGSL